MCGAFSYLDRDISKHLFLFLERASGCAHAFCMAAISILFPFPSSLLTTFFLLSRNLNSRMTLLFGRNQRRQLFPQFPASPVLLHTLSNPFPLFFRRAMPMTIYFPLPLGETKLHFASKT